MDKKARSNGMVEFSLKVWVRVFISEDDLRMEPEFDQIIRSDKDLAEKEQLVEELIVKIANDRLVEASVSAGKDYGLHVLSNLQYLTPKENYKKRNKWDGTIENNGWRNLK